MLPLNMKDLIHSKIYKKNLVRKPLLIGVFALFMLYFLILTLANSFQHFIEEFTKMWYWISLLVIGFGIQVSLYVYTKEFIKIKNKIGTGNIVVSSGISTGSMVACCAHHLTDILPIMGLSVFAVFLDKYQLLFIIIGVLSNFIGISYTLRNIQKQNLYRKDKGILRKLVGG